MKIPIELTMVELKIEQAYLQTVLISHEII